MRRIKTGLLTIVVAALALSACANNAPLPSSLLTQAENNLEQARSVNAEKHAPLALREGKKHLAKARSAIANNEHAAARAWLEKSVADTNLAIAKAHAQKSQKAADQVEENLRVLEREVNSKQQ
jgi:hypothetical protein